MANSTAELGLLKDILYPLLYARLYPTKSKKSGRQKPSPPPEGEEVSYPEVEEFADYFSTTLLPTLPPPSTLAAPSFEADTLSPPPELLETLITYSLIPDPASAEVFVEDLIGEYVKVVRAEAERAGSVEEVGVLRAAPGGKKECEICEREVPLSFHHLIPKEVHAKALKRKWHKAEDLNKGTWICRPCHNMVHRLEDNETLARRYYTVELLMEREELQRWADWVGRQKFKVKRG